MVRSSRRILVAVILAATFFLLREGLCATEAAKEATKEAVKDTTPEYAKLLDESRALVAKNDNAGAKTLLEKAEKLAPTDSGVARALVEAYIATNSLDNASTLLTKILSSNDFKDLKDWAAMQYYNVAGSKEGIEPATKKLELLTKNSKNVGLHRGVAEGYVRLRDWGKVATIYENLIKDNPNDQLLVTRLVDVYMLNKDYAKVIKILEPKVTADANDIASSDLLARAYVGAQMSDEAIALYKVKVAKDPNSPGLRGRSAQALMDLGMPEASLAEWSAAFKLDPSNLLFKQRMAEVYMDMGKLKEARKEYSELLGLIPKTQTGFKDTIASRIKDIDSAKK